MQVRRLGPGDEDGLERFLAGHVETSMFLCSNLRRAGLEDRGEPYQGTYLAAVTETGAVAGVAAHYWNGNVMVQAPDTGVLAALAAAVRRGARRPVSGLMGEDGQAVRLIDALGLAAADYKVNRSEGLYALDLRAWSPPTGVVRPGGVAVPARDVDEGLLRRWFRAYEIEALGAADGAGLAKRVDERMAGVGSGTGLWALVVDGEPVALCGFNARLPDIVQLGPVWTPPPCRNRGHARTLVALTLSAAKAEGVARAILFTDDAAAVRAYEAVGFEETGAYRLALLRRPVTLGPQASSGSSR